MTHSEFVNIERTDFSGEITRMTIMDDHPHKTLDIAIGDWNDDHTEFIGEELKTATFSFTYDDELVINGATLTPFMTKALLDFINSKGT